MQQFGRREMALRQGIDMVCDLAFSSFFHGLLRDNNFVWAGDGWHGDVSGKISFFDMLARRAERFNAQSARGGEQLR